jgi:hypothetical protein
MIVIRKILRDLMKKNLVACGEETNFIDIPMSLIENIDKIRRLLTSQSIRNDIKYVVFKRDNYTCFHCGENGRPLKIAYLTAEKNENHLDKLVPV